MAMVEAEGEVMTGSEALDRTVADDVRAWVQQAVTEHARIDVVHNKAGVVTMGGIATLILEDWTWPVDRELNQVFSATRRHWATEYTPPFPRRTTGPP
jgi:NADP-dependent 3-hydroxy acid dehydrogenase YdfG